ncbi:RNA recognition motif domain, eukaryote, Nucleotide-binding alpha-beta plait domain protein [Artemisia annua]|uniref:RNA recognition motif domain, eukaryote, Nucleotide-binding alpha-beta plait domain protein n=1 Tax=Artemisia annua TaxID=35608 RepID=A0A2U1PKP1_ARTAN|nr:RNA recognition motif domain, eukaryote, Nucleotide-binding alpha-beta plait domain protein [Artemisia annua]
MDIERKEPQFTNVFVKNLDLDFTESPLIEKFSEYRKNAKKAIEALNDAEIGSKKWFVGKAMKKSERDAILKRSHQKQKPDLLNMLVRNIATSVNENDMREVFGALGCVTSAKVICDENGVSKGFAYVCFSKSEEAKKAIHSLNGNFSYMFPFRGMVQKSAEKEDLVPNYQELLEKQVEKENRVQSHRSHWKARCFQELSKFKVFGGGDRVCFSGKRVGRLALWVCDENGNEVWRWDDNVPGNGDGLYRGFLFNARLDATP